MLGCIPHPQAGPTQQEGVIGHLQCASKQKEYNKSAWEQKQFPLMLVYMRITLYIGIICMHSLRAS